MDTDLTTFRYRDVALGGLAAATVFLSPPGSAGWVAWPDRHQDAAGPAFIGELDEDDADFIREKFFFETIPREDLRDYRGEYVAIHGQRIADHDRDLYALTNRFFSTFGEDAPVYVAFVGTKPRHFVPGPILR